MGNQNSRNSSSNPQGEEDDIADMKFENVISYVAAKYITQANFKDLQNLHKPDYCNKLVILTSKVIKHFLNDMEIEYLDQNFNLIQEKISGIEARVIQHEYDHLNGVLFIDYLSAERKNILNRKLAAIKKGKFQKNYDFLLSKK